MGQFPGLDTDNQKKEVSESETDKTREGQGRTKTTALTQSRLK